MTAHALGPAHDGETSSLQARIDALASTVLPCEMGGEAPCFAHLFEDHDEPDDDDADQAAPEP